MSEMESPDVKGRPSVMWVDSLGMDERVERSAKFSKEVLFEKSKLRLFSLGIVLYENTASEL